MQFTPTKIAGVWKLQFEPIEDERGFFARTYCRRQFKERGLVLPETQTSFSLTKRKGTIRGLHFQKAPKEEAKLVRCVRGGIFDVVVDIRPDSPTYKRWIGETLTFENRTMLYISPGIAHGFQTLEDNTEVLYQISEEHDPLVSAGYRWDDPTFKIVWPILPPTILSQRDKAFPHIG